MMREHAGHISGEMKGRVACRLQTGFWWTEVVSEQGRRTGMEQWPQV